MDFELHKKRYFTAAITSARLSIAKHLESNAQFVDTGDKRYFVNIFERPQKYTFKTDHHVDMVIGSPELDIAQTGSQTWITLFDDRNDELIEYDALVKNRRFDIPLACTFKTSNITSMLNAIEFLIDKSGIMYFEYVWMNRKWIAGMNIDRETIDMEDLSESTTETDEDSRNHTVVNFTINLDITYFQFKDVILTDSHSIKTAIHTVKNDNGDDNTKTSITNNTPNSDITAESLVTNTIT